MVWEIMAGLLILGVIAALFILVVVAIIALQGED